MHAEDRQNSTAPDADQSGNFAQFAGSRLGAGSRSQVGSEAVTEAEVNPLTRAKTGELHAWQHAPSVRIEGVRGSNPLSSTVHFGQRPAKRSMFRGILSVRGHLPANTAERRPRS